MKTLRRFKKTLLVIGIVLSQFALCAAKPNVIILLTDDQGYGDMSFHGNPVLETPQMDRLAKDSTRFSQFCVSPLCQPTRASLLTGRNKVIGRRIEPNEQTLPELFKRGGYSTAIFGKWHLGEYAPFRPIDKGFDEQLIIGGGAISQVQDYWGNTNDSPMLNHNDEWEPYSGYVTDILFDEAMGWMEQKHQNDEPFFCYLSTNAAHFPFSAPEEFEKPFRDQGMDEQSAAFYGMIANLDYNLGRLREHLEKLGIEEDTLLVFMNDNGSALALKKGLYNANLRGAKSSVYEGGVRAAAFFYWPGTLKADYEIDQLAMHYDILPTMSELCDIPLKEGEDVAELDGMSLKPLLFGEEATYPERYYVVYQGAWPPDQPLRKYGNTSIRSQNYRLANGNELYDLRNDISETKNLFFEQPEKAKELLGAYDKWWEKMSPQLGTLRVYKAYPIGENPGDKTTMTALHYYDSRVEPSSCKWYDVMFWRQAGLEGVLDQEKAETPKNEPLMGAWKMDFKSPGTYKFTLNKGTKSTPEEMTVIEPGTAYVRVGHQQIEVPIAEKCQSVEVDVILEKAGIQFLECWFDGQRKDGKFSGAYFIDVERVK